VTDVDWTQGCWEVEGPSWAQVETKELGRQRDLEMAGQPGWLVELGWQGGIAWTHSGMQTGVFGQWRSRLTGLEVELAWISF